MRDSETSDFSTVVHCYRMLDKFFSTCDLLDYTEGIYHNQPDTPLEVAQRNQLNYLLDEVQCGPGSKVLDVGCGNGTLLDEIRARGGTGIGITISPEQVKRCRKRGLDVRLLNYQAMADEWNGYFDAIVANGSIEHFVQPLEAARNQQDSIYRRMFQLCHHVIDPKSPSRRVVTTVIHFTRRIDPQVFLSSPFIFRPFSDQFHFAFLAKSFGGFYPSFGQLEECAQDYFEVVNQIDGTQDYFLTSEEWLRRGRRAFSGVPGLKILAKSLPHILRHPRHFATMMTSLLITQSWNWQFRTDQPPTRLLRQTWAYRPA